MGRKKKQVELSEVGRISSKDSPSSKPDKNLKKWEKMINKAFNQKIQYEDEQLFEIITEKFNTDQEVKNIISELFIKIKNCDYYVKKQWNTLKKFSLQEKIHREESKIISQNEKHKINEIYTEAIEKLAACHMTGFEPLNILRSKILNKIQVKYSISEENMKELGEHFNTSEAEDELLVQKRNEDQLAVLKKIISNTALFNYKDVDKNVYLATKAEIKKYEKELELKASLNEVVEEKSNLNSQIIIDSFNYNDIDNNKQSSNDNEASELFDEDEQKIRLTDFVSCPMKDLRKTVECYKEKTVEELRSKVNSFELQGLTQTKEPVEFRSVILNTFSSKLRTYGKLSDFDMQILLYLSHSIVTELIYSKNNRKDYSLEINPEELIAFLSKFKIDISHIEKQQSNTSDSPMGEMNDVNMN